MLDIRATIGTPGNVTIALLANLVAIAANDGSAIAGVPLRPDARLCLWGSNSIIADSISHTRLISQDQIDPINGEIISLGTTSVQNQAYKWTNIAYATGARIISQSTNAAQAANSQGFTIDWYQGGPTANPGYLAEKQITRPQTLAADVAITWTGSAFAPAVAIPNGKYAILGFYTNVVTEAHLFRFAHADFGAFKPGIPTVGLPNTAILGWQQGMKDYIHTTPGYQFVAISDILGKPVCPVFTASNAGTGLIIESLAAAATDTPQLTLNLAKVG